MGPEEEVKWGARGPWNMWYVGRPRGVYLRGSVESSETWERYEATDCEDLG